MADPIEHVYECAQCQKLFPIGPWEDMAGRTFCSISCLDEYEMRQGELQAERRLS